MAQLITLPPRPPKYPSQDHYQALRRQLRSDGYGSFSTAQLWHWHGYDYGWRRAYLHENQDTSPIDTGGQWFDPELATAAENFFRTKIGNKGIA